MMERNDIIKLACIVRQHVKTWVKDVDNIDASDMQGACAIVSYTLWKLLTAHGIQCNLYLHSWDWGSHCWVEIDGMFLDATAEQFGGPVVAFYPCTRLPQWFIKELPLVDRSPVSWLRNENAVEELESWNEQNPMCYTDEINSLLRDYAPKKEEQHASNS